MIKETRFFDYRTKDLPYHFWIIQGVVFLYALYRLISRDYSIYGAIPEEFFNYPRPITNLYPPFVLEIFNSHWVYWFIDYPDLNQLSFLQDISMLIAVLGLLGIYPKFCAVALFILLTHFTGFIQATNAEIEGGTLLLVSFLVLTVSPKNSFYTIFRNKRARFSNDYRWPVVLLFVFVGAFYAMSGLNKLIDVGPWWPFVLHLENMSTVSMEHAVFLSSRRVDFDFCSHMGSYWLSTFFGIVTLIGEIGFISILFLPRYRFFFVFSMIALHVAVYLQTGINFLGSSFILLLCFDWNSFFRKVTVYYDADCGFCERTMKIFRAIDFFKRMEILPAQSLNDDSLDSERLTREIGVNDNDGTVHYGAEAFEILCSKSPLGWPFALLYKLPGFIHLAQFIYGYVARNRHQFGDSDCGLRQ